MDADDLARAFERNKWVIDAQTAGLDDDDSLLQAGFRANCLNWVVGHVVASRDEVLRALGRRPMLSRSRNALYARESEPIHGPDSPHVPLPELLGLLAASQEVILDALASAGPDELARPVGRSGQPLADWLGFLAWHETYHCGQTDVLRQLAGTDDKVI